MEAKNPLAERAQAHTLVGAGFLGFTGVLGASVLSASTLAVISVVLVGTGGAGLLVVALMWLVRAQAESGGDTDEPTPVPAWDPERVG